jgi:hypothetical protein
MNRSKLIAAAVIGWLQRFGSRRTFDDCHLYVCAFIQRQAADQPPVSDSEVKAAIRSSPDWQLSLAVE